MTPSRGKNLLKSTLTKNITYNETPAETPDTSANNTGVGIQKARAQFNLFKVILFQQLLYLLFALCFS